jgi:hypothetical protein
MSKSFKLSTDVKKQHTVPRFLLDHFGFGKKNKKRRLFTFDKQNEREFQQSVFDATTRNTFYNINDHPEKASLEPILGIYETKAAPIIKKIITANNISCLSEDEQIIIATFTAIQRARSFGELQRINHAISALSGKLEGMGASPEQIEKELGSEESSERKTLFLKMILDQNDVITHIMNKSWILYETDKTNPFYISDNPITLHNDIDMGFYGNLGIGLKGIQIHLPLSTTLTLAFTCPSIAERAIKSKRQVEQMSVMNPQMLHMLKSPSELVTYGEAYETGAPMRQTADNVRFLNSLQVTFSELYVFSEKSNFSLVKEMVANNESYKTGPRMQVN